MSEAASNPTARLVVVASDPGRAQTLAKSLADALGSADEPCVVGAVAAALSRLRSEPCEAVAALHEPPQVDALVLARALRGAGDETPVAILGRDRSIDLEEAAWRAGADEYACLSETTAQQLAGRIQRAIDAREQLRVSRRALVGEQLRLSREQEETDRLILTQQRLVAELRGMPDRQPPDLPASFPLRGDAALRYAECVRTVAVDGPRSGREMSLIADDLAAEAVGGPALLELHMNAVAEMVRGLAPKAEIAVRDATGQLLLESVVHLAEAYRRRYLQASQTEEDSPAARAA